MTIEVNEFGYTTITPDEGKWLTNGDTYADSTIYLGKFDNPSNWWEVDEPPEDDEEITEE